MVTTEQIDALRIILRYLQYRSSPPGRMTMGQIADTLGIPGKRELNLFFGSKGSHATKVAFYHAVKPKLRRILAPEQDIPPSMRVICDTVFPGEGFHNTTSTIEENIVKHHVSIGLSAWGILCILKTEIDSLEGEKPNSDAFLEEWEKKLDFLKSLELKITSLVHSIDALHRPITTSTEVLTSASLIEDISTEFRVWLERNRPELVDWALRLPIAASSLGLLGLVGANMTWATPFVLASVGGERAIKVISALWRRDS